MWSRQDSRVAVRWRASPSPTAGPSCCRRTRPHDRHDISCPYDCVGDRCAEGGGCMLRLGLGFSGAVGRISVERAIAEFRAARPVLIEDGSERALAVSIEALGEDLCEA